jgi:hypothetical protein
MFICEPFDDIRARESKDLIKGLLPSDGIGFIAGPSGSGKSFLALDWCLTLANGGQILGHRTNKCGVIYVASEAPNGIKRRVEAWRQDTGTLGIPFSLIPQAIDLGDENQVRALVKQLKVEAGRFLEMGLCLRLIVIDTLAASIPSMDENSAADMSGIISNLALIGRELTSFVLVIAHTGKDESRGLRGWSGLFAGADLVIMLTRENRGGGAEARIGEVVKFKEGVDGERFAFTLRPVVLRVDEDGDDVTSAVVAYEAAPIRKTGARAKQLNQAAILTLAVAKELAGPIPALAGLGTKIVGVSLDELRKAVFDRGLKAAEYPGDDAPKVDRDRWAGARRKAFQRAVEDLLTAERIGQDGGWIMIR